MVDSLLQAVAKFGAIVASIKKAEDTALETAGKSFVKHIKHAIGTYEYGWPPLQPATIAKKKAGDTPLLETGELRDSYSCELHGQKVLVGSDNMKAVWHEYGTSRVPPRPVIGGTIKKHGQEIALGVGAVYKIMFVSMLNGSSVSGAITSATSAIEKKGGK
jgi:hypothetical protein